MLPQGAGLEGHLAVEQHLQVVALAVIAEDRLLLLGAGQEQGRHGELVGQRHPVVGGHLAQEALGHGAEQTAAVAGLAVGGDGAAMDHAGQGSNGILQQLVAGPVLQVGDQPEAAAVLELIGIVHQGGVLCGSVVGSSIW